MAAPRTPLRCRLGWHRWKRVTFRYLPGVGGRYCADCEKMQNHWRGDFFSGWATLSRSDRMLFQPNEDAHGYY